MNSRILVRLNVTPAQQQRLLALQAAFAQVCNALAPLVQSTRIWNRVALHHMAYRQLREQFPAVGSQMVCNAIYSVSRHSRALFQSEGSPVSLAKLGTRPLPLLRFADTCPVYFDRHTLSLKDGQLSMYTLDGRIRFQLALRPEDEARFHDRKLRELVLSRTANQHFMLAFTFSEEMVSPDVASKATDEDQEDVGTSDLPGALPQYLQLEELHASP